MEEVNVPKKLPKGTKKIEMGRTYNYRYADGRTKQCKTCGERISFDDFSASNRLPVHVDEEGKIIGDGTCQEWEDEKR